MNYSILERILIALGGKMDVPKVLGAFHIIWIVFILGLCVLAVYFRRYFTEKTVPYVLLGVGILMILYEVYRQLIFSYLPESDRWVYLWYNFPFQFCASPDYVTVAAFILSRCKKRSVVYDALLSFLATYCLIAGVVVFIFPSTIFCDIIGINIQTMLHHGLMIVMAVMLLASGEVKFTRRSFLMAFLVFMPLLTVAMIMNLIYGNGFEFDMFYIAPDSTMILDDMQAALGGFPPYPVYLIGYIILFSTGAALVLFISRKISDCAKNRKKKK